MTKKRKRTYLLKDVKDLIKRKQIANPNIKVIQSASEIGCSLEEAFETILNLSDQDFFQSITEYYDHTTWQDVYKKVVKNIPVYIKFKISLNEERFVLLSFKKDE